MSSTFFDNYDKKFPNIVMEIVEYFNINNSSEKIKDKSVLKFCEKYEENGTLKYQPNIVNRICKRLCDCGQFECIKSLGGMGLNDNYLIVIRDRDFFQKERQRLIYYYNSMVYGFDYIYNMYKDIVVPFVWDKGNGDYSAGTGFKFLDGIVTAKHCIEDVANLQIKGYTAKELENKPVYISDIDGVDLAFIQTGEVAEPLIYTDEGKVMQEVLVMGYPKVPAFTNFLTAEKALISCKASSRITPTRGTIAAFGFEFLTKFDAMLITAKIRGGNSGGPIINQCGCLVGVACHLLDNDNTHGEYDDLGYGVAVPVKYLMDILNKKSKQIDIPKGFYKDFIE